MNHESSRLLILGAFYTVLSIIRIIIIIILLSELLYVFPNFFLTETLNNQTKSTNASPKFSQNIYAFIHGY